MPEKISPIAVGVLDDASYLNEARRAALLYMETRGRSTTTRAVTELRHYGVFRNTLVALMEKGDLKLDTPPEKGQPPLDPDAETWSITDKGRKTASRCRRFSAS